MTSSTSNSRRTLLFKGLVWGVLFLVANRLAAGPVERMISTPVKRLKLAVSHSTAQTVILGDSHAMALGGRPDVLNLAEGGDSFSEMEAKLRYCLREGKPIRSVILQVDWNSFSTVRSIRNNRQQGERFTDQGDFNAVYGGGSFTYWWHRSVLSYLPLLNPINARLSRRYLVHRFWKTEELLAPWNSLSEQEQLSQAKEHFRANYARFDNQQATDFLRLLDFCQQSGLNVIGLRCPLAPRYREWAYNTDERRQSETVVEESGLVVQDWTARFTEPTHFVNQDHLWRGSEAAQQILDSLLEKVQGSALPVGEEA